MRTLPTLGDDRVAALNAAWEKKPQGRAGTKLQVLRLVGTHEHSAGKIAGIAGVSRATVFNDIDLFVTGGVEGLLKQGRPPGRPASITSAVAERLAAVIDKEPMRTAGRLVEWLKRHEKLTVTTGIVYHWLGKIGWVLKMPRKTHVKKDEAKAAEFRKNLALHLQREVAALEAQDSVAVAEGRIRIWVADERRHGLIPVIRRVWAPKGKRVTAPYVTKYEWLYSYEALEVDGAHGCECLFLPEVSKECSGVFLRQNAESDPESLHIVIWDGAGFHPKRMLEGLPRVRLITLPAYGPELNPVELLGDITKDKLCNRIFDTLGALEDKLTETLKPFLFDPQCVKRLIPNRMLEQANSSAPT